MVNGIKLKSKFFGFLVVSAFFASCGGEKEKANTYYDEFTAIILPYKEGTERILTEIQGTLQKQLKASGKFTLSQQDSIRQEELIRQFATLAQSTITGLESMKEMPESELKSAGLAYVQHTSESILGAYRDIVLPMQDSLRRPSRDAIDSLSEIYSDQLVRSNEDFASRQLEFLKKSGLLNL